MNSATDAGEAAREYAALVDRVLRQFEVAGYLRYPHQPVRASNNDRTLFISGGIQNWRRWVLEGHPGQARTGAQWCVRTNQLDDLPEPRTSTSFCMISAVRQGEPDHQRAIEDTISTINAIGIPPHRLGFIVSQGDSAGTPDDSRSRHVLASMGIGDDQIATRPRRWSHPFRPHGPAGPNLFVLAEIARPCSTRCTPHCGCGRYKHLANCEFLDFHRDPDGALRQTPIPVTDIAISAEWLACALAGTRNVWHAEPYRSAVQPIRDQLLQGTAEAQATDDDIDALLDHGRTVALLLGAGIDFAHKRAGHVLRRLFRRILTLLAIHEQPLELATGIVGIGSAFSFGCHGFPQADRITVRLTDLTRETQRFQAILSHGRKSHRRALTTATGPADLARALFRIKSDQGVPLPLLVSWSASAGRAIATADLQAMLAGERSRSRPNAKTQGES